MRLCSLENFNKSYIGVLGIDQCPLREHLLDMSLSQESPKFPESLTLRKVSDKLAGFALNDT